MAKKPENGREYNRRQSAYHEAGHASMFWFFQQPGLIRKVCLEEDGGVVYADSPAGLFNTRDARGLQANAMMLVMHCFAGPCAGNLCDEEFSDFEPDFWFTWLCDDYEKDGSDYAKRQSPFDEDDMAGAIAIAQKLNPRWKNKGVRKFLGECAEWTSEALALDPMRETIDALAKKLLKSKTGAIEGQRAWKIISHAWGDRELPLHQRKWKARFSALEK